MRCIHTLSGLLSIVGAAFLFGTVHALVIEPVDLSKAETKDAAAPVNSPDGPRVPRQTTGGDQSTDAVADDPADSPADDEGDTDAQPSDAQDNSAESPVEISVTDAALDAPVPEGTLTLRQSYDLWEQGAYFVDARHEEEFEEGHIEYSVWLASSLFDTDSDRAFAVADSMQPDATVVIYCVGGECDASHNTARRLQQIGFTDLRIMGVGYSDWVDAGFPTAEGSAP